MANIPLFDDLMFGDKKFHTWRQIGWSHRQQQIRDHVAKSVYLTWN